MMNILLVAAVYGTLVGGDLVRAPYAVKTDVGTAVASSLDESTANALGYKLVVDVPPVCASNEYISSSMYDEREVTDERGVQRMRIFRDYEKSIVVPPPRKWTPRSIKVACGDRWPTVKAALVEVDMFDEFVMSQVIDESCDSFAVGYAIACERFGKATVDEILDRAEIEP